MENDKELKRNGEKESLVEINDNNRREMIEEKKYQYEKKLSEIKSLGYENSVIEFDEQNEPQAIIIYGKDNMPIASYTDKGLQVVTQEGLKLQEKLYELDQEEQKKLQEGINAEKVKENNSKTLNGEQEEIDENQEEKADNQKSITELEEELEEQTGSEYEIIGKISYTGNEKIVSKIHETEGFTGEIYKVRNKSTGAVSIAGIGPDGRIKEVDYKRIPAPLGKEVIEHKEDGSVVETSFKSQELIVLPGTNVVLDATAKELNAVVNYNGENPHSFRVEVEPTVEKTTTQEVDEMKQDPVKMEELTELINYAVNRGYMTKEEGEEKIGQMTNDGYDLDENIEKQKELNKQNDREAEDRELEDEEELDESWFIYGMPRNH